MLKIITLVWTVGSHLLPRRMDSDETPNRPNFFDQMKRNGGCELEKCVMQQQGCDVLQGRLQSVFLYDETAKEEEEYWVKVT